MKVEVCSVTDRLVKAVKPADAVPEFWLAVCSAVPVSTNVLNVDAGSILRVWILEEPLTVSEDSEVPVSED